MWFASFIGLCAFAWLRGEAAGVQLDDIDFLRRTLTARRQVQRTGGGQAHTASDAPSLLNQASTTSRLRPKRSLTHSRGWPEGSAPRE